jgi:type I restriction enzyme S subunit
MEIDGYVSSHLATIKAKAQIADDKYLLHYLTTVDAKDLMQDIAYPSLKTSDIGLIPVPLPPLHEQQRIVTILDEAFAAIDQAKANTERNLKNAKELFESYLQGVFENKGDGWEEKKLIDVCELKPQKKEARDKLNETDLVTFLPMEDLGVLNKVALSSFWSRMKELIKLFLLFEKYI